MTGPLPYSRFSPFPGGMSSQRQLRVGEEIRRLLAELILRTEFRDPDLRDAQLTVTEARVSPDLRHATVYVGRLGHNDIKALLPALQRVAPFLRSKIARRLTLRSVPDLHFAADETLETAEKMARLLNSGKVRRDVDASAPEAGGG